MGCDLSLELWNEDRNDVTIVCLTCCWQPVGSLSVQMFAKSENTKCSPLVESMGCDLSLESSWNEDRNDVTFVCQTACWQPKRAQEAHRWVKGSFEFVSIGATTFASDVTPGIAFLDFDFQQRSPTNILLIFYMKTTFSKVNIDM